MGIFEKKKISMHFFHFYLVQSRATEVEMTGQIKHTSKTCSMTRITA